MRPEAYSAAVTAANGLTPEELEGLRRNELPLFVIQRIDAELRQRRSILFFTMAIVFAVLLLISMTGSSSDDVAMAWVFVLGAGVFLGLLVVVMESRRSAQLRAPIIDFAHGELEKTRDKYRPHLMRVPGSPILVFTADQYRACEEGQSHTLAWLRGTDQGIAVFSGRAPHLGESNR